MNHGAHIDCHSQKKASLASFAVLEAYCLDHTATCRYYVQINSGWT